MRYAELTYANPNDKLVRRWVIRSIEELSGRRKLARVYGAWRQALTAGKRDAFNAILDLMRIRLDVAGALPPAGELPARLVMVANHPFGIGDGVAILALAERLDRPFRILIHNDLMKIPEMAAYGLPVNFEETKEAVAMNMAMRHEAIRLLAQGTTIIVFPAGGVATAPRIFGAAQDFPWKQFTARLVQSGRASVLPIYFEGQNGPLFHLASRFSLTLRLGLLIGEFRRLYGRALRVTVGRIIAFEELSAIGDRKLLTERLRAAVFALGPVAPGFETFAKAS